MKLKFTKISTTEKKRKKVIFFSDVTWSPSSDGELSNSLTCRRTLTQYFGCSFIGQSTGHWNGYSFLYNSFPVFFLFQYSIKALIDRSCIRNHSGCGLVLISQSRQDRLIFRDRLDLGSDTSIKLVCKASCFVTNKSYNGPFMMNHNLVHKTLPTVPRHLELDPAHFQDNAICGLPHIVVSDCQTPTVYCQSIRGR